MRVVLFFIRVVCWNYTFYLFAGHHWKTLPMPLPTTRPLLITAAPHESVIIATLILRSLASALDTEVAIYQHRHNPLTHTHTHTTLTLWVLCTATHHAYSVCYISYPNATSSADGRHNIPGFYPPYGPGGVGGGGGGGGYNYLPLPHHLRRGPHSSASSVRSSKTGVSRRQGYPHPMVQYPYGHYPTPYPSYGYPYPHYGVRQKLRCSLRVAIYR